MITEVVGDEWRKCLVWDTSCGSGNLTKNYHFDNLILSTLEQRDIDLIKEQRYNDGAVIEQFDFLNDRMPSAIKKKLEEAEEIVFYMNPPFGTSSTNKKDGSIKSNIAETKIKNKMVEVGRAKKQLYAQFLYRILSITKEYKLKGYICFYSVPTFMTGLSFKKFRAWWNSQVEFKDGSLFPSRDFGAKGDWGVSFTIWERVV